MAFISEILGRIAKLSVRRLFLRYANPLSVVARNENEEVSKTKQRV